MLIYARLLTQVLIIRVHAVRERPNRDRGASALEWAIIAAIAVVIATVIGTVIYNVVSDKGTQLKNCADQPVGGTCK